MPRSNWFLTFFLFPIFASAGVCHEWLINVANGVHSGVTTDGDTFVRLIDVPGIQSAGLPVVRYRIRMDHWGPQFLHRLLGRSPESQILVIGLREMESFWHWLSEDPSRLPTLLNDQGLDGIRLVFPRADGDIDLVAQFHSLSSPINTRNILDILATRSIDVGGSSYTPSYLRGLEGVLQGSGIACIAGSINARPLLVGLGFGIPFEHATGLMLRLNPEEALRRIENELRRSPSDYVSSRDIPTDPQQLRALAERVQATYKKVSAAMRMAEQLQVVALNLEQINVANRPDQNFVDGIMSRADFEWYEQNRGISRMNTHPLHVRDSSEFYGTVDGIRVERPLEFVVRYLERNGYTYNAATQQWTQTMH